jgi:hypothetical protein
VNEYCPKCGQPVEWSPESDRLCETCGHFFDRREALHQWPPQGKIVENIVEVLGLYRSLCRDEMRLDGAPMSMVVHAQREVKKAQQSIVQMFLSMRQP